MNHTEAYEIVGHFKSSKLFLAVADSVNVLLLSTAKSDASRTASILFNIQEHVITCYQIPKIVIHSYQQPSAVVRLLLSQNEHFACRFLCLNHRI